MTDKNSKDSKNADENAHDEEKKVSTNIIVKETLIESGREENDDFDNNDDASNYFEHRNEEVNGVLNNEGDILNIAEEKKNNEDLEIREDP